MGFSYQNALLSQKTFHLSNQLRVSLTDQNKLYVPPRSIKTLAKNVKESEYCDNITENKISET